MRPNFSYKFNQPFLFLTFILLLTAYSLQLNATVRFVSKTGNSTPPYLTWETAADSIQKCINICVFGDTIYVANGVYQEQVVMIPGLSLIGAGMDSCVIDTRQLVTSQNFTSVAITATCLLKGFLLKIYNNSDKGIGIAGVGNVTNSLITENRITNGYEGIYLGGNPFIFKNKFDYLSVGVEFWSSNGIVRKNTIFTDPNSQLPLVTAIFIQANTTNYHPMVDSNYIETNYNGIYKNPGTRSTVRNNIIRIINGSEGIFLHSYVSDSAWVYNNLIITNLAGWAVDNIGIPYLNANNNYIIGNFNQYGLYLFPNNVAKNNVITNTHRGIGRYGTPDPIIQYNNHWNNEENYHGFAPDSTNISVDPMIVNNDTTQGELDFHLQKFSPLIDTGDPNILDKDSTRSDIGLYGGPYGESYIYIDYPPRPPVNLTANVDSLIKLNWNKNTEADFSYYNVYRDTAFNFTVDSTKLVASVTDTFYSHTFPSNVETLYYKLTAVDNQGNESNPSEQVSAILVSVTNEWVPVNNYILYQNYPNPFNPSTKIGYKLKERGYVKLYVYDIKGELVSVLVNQVQEAGYYEVEFSATVSHSGEVRNLSSGVYIYQIFVKGENNIPVFSDIKKMVYVK